MLYYNDYIGREYTENNLKQFEQFEVSTEANLPVI